MPADPKTRTIHLYTIGFTKKSAEAFFSKLSEAHIKRLIDVRLNNSSQLAAFTKKDDLRYFLRAICGIEYDHFPILAPTQELFDSYKKQGSGWETYEKRFLDLMLSRKIEAALPKEKLDGACLLCSEQDPAHCHRRLVAEYLRDKWTDAAVQITHIL